MKFITNGLGILTVSPYPACGTIYIIIPGSKLFIPCCAYVIVFICIAGTFKEVPMTGSIQIKTTKNGKRMLYVVLYYKNPSTQKGSTNPWNTAQQNSLLKHLLSSITKHGWKKRNLTARSSYPHGKAIRCILRTSLIALEITTLNCATLHQSIFRNITTTNCSMVKGTKRQESEVLLRQELSEAIKT